MTTAKEHYENLLAERYTWLMGGMEPNFDKNSSFFQSLRLEPRLSGNAVDLGAGAGFQSIPLAQAGFKVTALDLSESLLQLLRDEAGDLPVTTVCDDMMRFSNHCPPALEVAVCMGDTLPHISKRDDVTSLLGQVCNRLDKGGFFIIGFRDLNEPHTGLDRFIPVRSDENRIFTCFLEYGPERVTVNDLIYERSNGNWTLHKGSYSKLRLDPKWISGLLGKKGMRIHKTRRDGSMVTIVARKQ